MFVSPLFLARAGIERVHRATRIRYRSDAVANAWHQRRAIEPVPPQFVPI
ncbi:MAG: hypothetical protein U5Q44_13775 [Dehalococcoidia bacterium]|nr:hypothetical protein [Dehalococcoidia bacterium]